ncbi:DNA gyrase subunit A [Chromobacterium violaceum]|uniref:DNA gyrase subunit A n=1 Tax=Chromobacterium violaceum TaxID=536 RepID=A0A447TD16_CHRVL|nr:DNA gyrase subunit A [Chromobacterium violaceum]
MPFVVEWKDCHIRRQAAGGRENANAERAAQAVAGSSLRIKILMTDNLFAKETLPISLEEEMRRSYLDYAMSVIVGRALPTCATA